MAIPPRDDSDIVGQLSVSLDRHRVPGGVIDLIQGGDIEVLSAGIARRDTSDPLDGSTLFQMGSVTKLYTATLVMQAVESGQLVLGARVVDVLRGFRLASPAFESITILHLLTHSSGLPEAHQVDTGDGEECLERYVRALADVRLDAGPGERSNGRALSDIAAAAFASTARLMRASRSTPCQRCRRCQQRARFDVPGTKLTSI